MRPLFEIPQEDLRKIKFVLTDIDDTLTTNGRLPAKSYQALEQLQLAGFKVIPITGRPAGWCDHIARMWPVDAVVGENGAFYFVYVQSRRKLVTRYWKSERERTEDRKLLEKIQNQIITTVKGSAVASDQAYREADLAIDYCEDVEPLPESSVNKIVDIFHQSGAEAKISSIHVNGWFGDYDKLKMTRILLEEHFLLNNAYFMEKIVFAGDSPNDEPMFGYFKNSVGVGNMTNFADQIKQFPAWVTSKYAAEGFVELADALLSAQADS
ncbi:MAG: Mannosyl-3-phosphoglycerate phosphatase [Deltaproteobacteria bacterium]|jgi:HAD superfamily hydrolase (TIGR01484 family)|nr:Mannosyl-3-phosphoglycerate phosphatase [Deltaproteobacteria bacterium]